MKLVWDESAWEDYLWWQGQDRKTLKRINTLIKLGPYTTLRSRTQAAACAAASSARTPSR